MNTKKTNKIFSIIVSIQTILMGIVFIIQILRIYYGNNKVFDREIVNKYLLEILPIILLWIIIIIISYIYYSLTNNPKPLFTKISSVYKLKNLYTDYEFTENESLKKEKIKMKIAAIINLIILVICSIMGLCYLLNVKHFDPQGNLSEQAIQMSIHLSPWVIISFTSLILKTFYDEIRSRNCVTIIKKILLDGSGTKIIKTNINNKYLLITRLFIISISVVLIIVGIINGEATDVLQKAINICTECIGLG